jgi:ATPase subunit of ABC transporter with duplicated ATPase domains
MLYKAVAIILSTILLAAVQMSTANAGGCHRGGGFHAYQASLQQSYALKQQRARQAAQAKAQARAVAAAKQRKALAAQQARAEKAEQTKVAAVEATSATEETSKVAKGKDGPENELTVAAAPETCTKFFAETGTTVSVECAKQ